jgi:chromosome segregation ATPase
MKRYLPIIPGIILGLILGLIIGHMQTKAVSKADQAKLKEMNQRLAQVQRRYTQGVSEQNTCEEEKQSVISESEKLKQERDKLASETKTLKTKTETLALSLSVLDKKKTASDNRIVALESKNSQLTERLTKTETDRNTLDRTQKQAFASLQEREKELKNLLQRYDRCAENNARLCLIGDELITRYRNRSFMKTVLEKEPFTQIKKVEIEKMARDYKDKIDKERIKK